MPPLLARPLLACLAFSARGEVSKLSTNWPPAPGSIRGKGGTGSRDAKRRGQIQKQKRMGGKKKKKGSGEVERDEM